MAKVLDGKTLATEVNDELKVKIENWVNQGNKVPSLRCILVGEDPASQTYVRNKIKAALDVGISAETLKFDTTITEQELLSEIQSLNKNKEIDGILIQLPLPHGIDERKICNAVAPEKDVDGFHIINVGQLCLDMRTIVPATALGVIEMLKR